MLARFYPLQARASQCQSVVAIIAAAVTTVVIAVAVVATIVVAVAAATAELGIKK